MTESDLQALAAAMERPLLLDRGGGVYWDFDFEKEEFRVGTACNAGRIGDFTVKYDEGERLCDQLQNLVEKAEEFYDEEESTGCR